MQGDLTQGLPKAEWKACFIRAWTKRETSQREYLASSSAPPAGQVVSYRSKKQEPLLR